MPLDSLDARFLRHALIIAGLIAIGLIVLKLADVLALGFGAILVAITLRAVAGPIRTVSGLGERAGVAVALVLLLVLAVAILWFFGRDLEGQLAGLLTSLPAAWAKVEAWLSHEFLGRSMLDQLRTLDASWLLSRAPGWASGAASTVAATVIVLFAGVFLALEPSQYVTGALRLLPVRIRPTGREVLVACGIALRQWLVAQFGSMLMMTVSIGGMLWVAGVGSPLALGLLAGLGQFVPVIGPFVTAVPAVLLAVSDRPEKAGWTILIYVVAGQIESNLFSPFMLRQTAQLPMAVTLLTVFAFGLLLGPAGVLFATPMAVVIYVMVKMLYVEGFLERGVLESRELDSTP